MATKEDKVKKKEVDPSKKLELFTDSDLTDTGKTLDDSALSEFLKNKKPIVTKELAEINTAKKNEDSNKTNQQQKTKEK